MSADSISKRTNGDALFPFPSIRRLFFLWLTLWLLRIPLGICFYHRLLDSGRLPPDADSISIPIALLAATTIVCAPINGCALWLLIRHRVPDKTSWFAWYQDDWLYGLIVTAVAITFVLMELRRALESLQTGAILNVAESSAWIYFWLALRGTIIAPGGHTPVARLFRA